MTEPTRAPREPFNSAATRTALHLARVLGGDGDPRIPEQLPADPDALRAAIYDLEQVGADHADLTMTHQPGVPQRERAYALMVYTRTAVDIIDSISRWARIANGDREPVHVAVYVAALGVLTHQLVTTGRTTSWFKDAAHACAMTVANDIADEPDTWVDAATLQARMDAADASLRPSAN